MKRLALLILLSAAAHAQTYDVSVTMDNLLGQNVTFAGNFTLANGAITSVNINGDPYAWGGTFTTGNIGTDSNGEQSLGFVDHYYLGPNSSFFYTLGFDLASPLAQGAVVDTNSIAVQSFGDYPLVCGGVPGLYQSTMTCSGSVTQAQTRATAAPELAPQVEPFILCLGLLLLFKTPKPARLPSPSTALGYRRHTESNRSDS